MDRGGAQADAARALGDAAVPSSPCSAKPTYMLNQALEKVNLLQMLLTKKHLASPQRWTWICNMIGQVRVLPEKEEPELFQMLQLQSDLLEDRAAWPQLVALARHVVATGRDPVYATADDQKDITAVTEPAVPRRVKRARALFEVPSPQPPLKFVRDNVGRVSHGPRDV